MKSLFLIVSFLGIPLYHLPSYAQQRPNGQQPIQSKKQEDKTILPKAGEQQLIATNGRIRIWSEPQAPSNATRGRQNGLRAAITVPNPQGGNKELNVPAFLLPASIERKAPAPNQ